MPAADHTRMLFLETSAKVVANHDLMGRERGIDIVVKTKLKGIAYLEGPSQVHAYGAVNTPAVIPVVSANPTYVIEPKKSGCFYLVRLVFQQTI